MSKSLSKTVNTQLAARKQNMAERLAGLGGDGGGMSFIKVKANKFRIGEDIIIPNEMTVVVLDWAFHNGFWSGAYNPNATEAPVCAAVGQNAATMGPPASAPDRQHDTCATCPQNQFGSGGGNRKACKNSVNLAVLRWDEEEEDDQIYFLSVPPMSLKAFKKYNSKLAEAGKDIAEVVTVITFDSSVDYVKFEFSADAKSTKEYAEEDEDGNSYAAGFLSKLPEATELVTREPSFGVGDEA